jgi:hypothetical protein
MKRNFKYIIAVVAVAIGLHSCSDIYDTLELSEAKSRKIVSSQMDYGNKVRIGGELTFGDISSGVVSRTWTFPEGAADIVGSDNDITSSDKNIKAIFNVPGVYDLKLHQEYDGDAYVTGSSTPKGKSLDTTIVVTVLPLIKVKVQANYLNEDGTLGAALNMNNGAKNKIIASKTIRYSLVTVGEPEKFIWTMTGGSPATSEANTNVLDIKYKKVGVFGCSVNANTPRPAGDATTTFTDLVNVIPSTDPVDLDGAQVFNGDIRLNFSREMDPASIRISDFSATINNKGVAYPATITSVSVDPIEGNYITVKLAPGQELYNDDAVTISYTKGTLTTADAVFADSFTNVSVSFVGINLLGKGNSYDGGFEDSTDNNWQYAWWGAPWDKYSWNITTAKAHTGKKSSYIEVQARGGMIVVHKNNSGANVTFNLVAGKTYEMGSWTYVESLGDKNSIPDLRFFISPNTDWGVGNNPGFSADYTVGKWVYNSTIVKINATDNYTFLIRSDNQGNSQKLKFYMDDITVMEAKIRP